MKLEGRAAIVTGAGQASAEAHWIAGQMLTADGGHTRH